MLLSHEQLFVHTVQDLRTKIRSNTTYSLIRACGLCRHLLLDETPLVHQVNKTHRLPLRFHIRNYESHPISNDYKGSGGRTILPIGKLTRLVKLEEFLNSKIHYSGRTEFTVKEFIFAGAHYYGGIHSGKPDIKQEQLAKLNRFYNKEHNSSFWHIGCICKVVLKAMKPLEAKIKPNPLPVDFNHSLRLPDKLFSGVTYKGR